MYYDAELLNAALQIRNTQQRQRIEALEAVLREIRTIASNRQNAVSWLQHKDALEAIEALVQDALEGDSQ